MISESKLFQIRNAINCHPELLGARIGFHGNLGSSVLDYGNPNSPNYDIIVIIEEVEMDLGLRVSAGINANVIAEPAKVLNKTVVGAELIGAGISCGFTVFAGAAVVGSAAAEVPTAGLSTVILIAAWTGFVTQGIQCVNGITRTVEAYRNPNDNSLERWDSNEWYNNTMLVVDGAGVLSGLVGVGGAAAGLKKMLTMKGALPSEEILQAMTNQQRVTAYREAVKKISKSPSQATEFDNLLNNLRPGIAKRLRENKAVIIRRSASDVSRLLSQKTMNALLDTTKEIVITGSGITFSGMSQQSVGSASGSVRWAGEHINNIVINIITNK